ncbi:hypothetical protein [Endozoicomonas acroporae]|uniref:hypothetical protein n=1 Tax=Endozoicomonas acroporae TaxID=1701104 RepID=UPI0013D526BB|nr:hypothetical protein [Endozoicomonas acroporae]
MSGKYAGFDLSAMLWFLHEYCEEVQLSKDGQDWRFYVLSEHHGEYENTGTLFHVVSFAFQPFLEVARKRRTEMRKKGDEFLKSIEAMKHSEVEE